MIEDLIGGTVSVTALEAIVSSVSVFTNVVRVYSVQPGYMGLVWVVLLVLKNISVGVDERQYEPLFSHNNRLPMDGAVSVAVGSLNSVVGGGGWGVISNWVITGISMNGAEFGGCFWFTLASRGPSFIMFPNFQGSLKTVFNSCVVQDCGNTKERDKRCTKPVILVALLNVTWNGFQFLP